ncbi:hypothetical protein FQA39_LY13453 [Lamprigera yunnana]|nr:hypothetical protein FQA39_LY13453 [Lamprigera yunnana]
MEIIKSNKGNNKVIGLLLEPQQQSFLLNDNGPNLEDRVVIFATVFCLLQHKTQATYETILKTIGEECNARELCEEYGNGARGIPDFLRAIGDN